MNLDFVKQHGFAIFVSIALHAALLIFLYAGWQAPLEQKTVKTPNFVKAKLVKLEAQKKPSKPAKNKPKVVDVSKKRAEQERLKKLAELKKKQALQKKQDEKKKKAEADRLKKEKQRKAKAAEERERQEQLRKQQERERMEKALAAEQMQLLEATYSETAQSYIGAISERIENNWSRPPSARNGMSCELLLKLVPTGRVVNVDIAKSSGNALFDRSAIQAVKKAEQFPEIKDMPIEVFERYYRDLTLVFIPQDLRQ